MFEMCKYENQTLKAYYSLKNTVFQVSYQFLHFVSKIYHILAMCPVVRPWW